VFFDYFSDPPKCPQFGLVAVSASPFQQPFFQLIDLFFRQTARPSRRTVGLEKRLALLFIGHTPLGYGSGRYANEPSGLVYAMSLLEQSNRLASPIR
jgi:hypothetical protein